VFVHNGSILGIPDIEKWGDVRKTAISTNIVYLDAIGSFAAAKIEAAAMCKSPITIQVKMARSPADINIYIEDYVMRFITDNKKKIDVRGPVFLTIRSEIRD
jgi:O-phosphoseryl-tRNA synthetase